MFGLEEHNASTQSWQCLTLYLTADAVVIRCRSTEPSEGPNGCSRYLDHHFSCPPTHNDQRYILFLLLDPHSRSTSLRSSPLSLADTLEELANSLGGVFSVCIDPRHDRFVLFLDD
jgi:hypothetical protein